MKYHQILPASYGDRQYFASPPELPKSISDCGRLLLKILSVFIDNFEEISANRGIYLSNMKKTMDLLTRILN